jgi:excisionase family DNA binding protein
MTNQEKNIPNDLLLQVRKLLPKRRMAYGDARIVAQQQALRMRMLLGTTATRLPLDFVEHIPGASVTMITAPEMEALTGRPNASGATDVRKDGTYRIFINENNSVTHCRFTLAHELFHVVNGQFEAEVFADFGHGDDQLHSDRVETVADHFAANLLMPSSLIKKAWGIPIQGLTELAELFGVSEEAMRIRLKTVGLIRSGVTKRMFYRVPRTARGAREKLATDWFKPQESMRLFLRRVAPFAADDESHLENDYGGIRCPGKVLTVDEACERLRISKWMLYRLIHERQIKTFKLGSRRLIPESALWALIEQLSGEEAA